ncbi:MAG: HAD-IA family hydrolase [Gammaproteobacteria bacterium]|nr:HAD-IA family hydrolase [Gammaproteobacteria bacterium]
MGGKPCRIPDAVLFDLDGTLLDTAGDLVAALNTILDEDGRPPMPLDTFRPWVSQGGLTLVSMAYGLPRESEEAQALWQRYLAAYESDISRHSCLFDGLEGILAGLESGSRPWGIVTNKPTYLTDRLLRELGMRDRPACMVCSDTAPRSKPWPDPVLLACEIMGVPPERALMVGDDERDVASARAAGADAVVAAWGYIRPDDDPATWGASAILPRPAALRPWVG